MEGGDKKKGQRKGAFIESFNSCMFSLNILTGQYKVNKRHLHDKFVFLIADVTHLFYTYYKLLLTVVKWFCQPLEL